MGCSSSKNIDAQLAGDFFGNESEHIENNNFSGHAAPEGATVRSAPTPEAKSILKSSPSNNGVYQSPGLEEGKSAKKKTKKSKSKGSFDDAAEPASPTHPSASSSSPSARPIQAQVQQQQPQQQQRVKKNKLVKGNVNDSNGSLNSSQQQQLPLQQQGTNQVSPGNKKTKVGTSQKSPNSRKNQPITSSHDNSSSNNAANDTSDPNTSGNKQRKSTYVAPPSSESFVVNPTPKMDAATKKGIGPTATPVSPEKPPPPHVAPPVPPPPPPFPGQSEVEGTSASTYAQQRSQHLPPEPPPPKPIVLDDDDFSVAPSLAVEMRSIVNHTFDDVYQRGKKVRSQDMWKKIWFCRDRGQSVELGHFCLLCLLLCAHHASFVRANLVLNRHKRLLPNLLKSSVSVHSRSSLLGRTDRRVPYMP
jgi:hypothetical protein